MLNPCGGTCAGPPAGGAGEAVDLHHVAAQLAAAASAHGARGGGDDAAGEQDAGADEASDQVRALQRRRLATRLTPHCVRPAGGPVRAP